MRTMSTYKVFGYQEHHKFYDENAYWDATHYITNPQKAVYTGGCNLTSLDTASKEMEETAKSFGKNSGKRIRHSELSFSREEGVTAEQANQFAQAIIQHYAPEYQIIYAVHGNTENVHIHFVMNQISYVDGHRYQGKKKDYYDFMRHIGAVTHLPVIPVRS